MPEQKPMSSLYITKGNTTYDLEMKDSVARAAIADATPLVFGTGLSKTTESGTTTITAPEMTGATASTAGTSGLVPAPAVADKDKFLKGDGTWTTISMTEQRVDILNKTTGLTEADFDTAWSNLENRHLVGVWLDDHLFIVTWKYIYPGNSQKRIIFTSIENSHWVEHTFGGIKYKYIAWYRGYTSLTSAFYNIIPDPVNHGGHFLKSNGTTVEWGSIKQVPSSSSTDEGKVLTVNSSGNAAWSTVSPYAPTPDTDDSLLLGQSDGSKTWTALENDVFGTQLLDELGQPIRDETQTPPTIMYDAGASTDLWTGFAGKGFGAIRAYADQDGHNIKATYLKKTEFHEPEEASEADIKALFYDMGTVEIGGRTYKTVIIGDQEWLAENLDYKFTGLDVGHVERDYSIPKAAYYDNDEATYGVDGNKYGLLYNWTAVDYLNTNRATLCNGWHVPSRDDWDVLISAVGESPSTKLRSETGWESSSYAGTDDFGFNAKPCGYSISQFFSVGWRASFWTSDAKDSSSAYYKYFHSGPDVSENDQVRYLGYSVRLVRDSV